MTKRNVFREGMGGVTAMTGHKEAKLTLRSYQVEAKAGRRITVPVQATDATVRRTQAKNATGSQPGQRWV